jgi:glycosyltransferase involved in cell wall biosynthesis
LEEGKEIKVYRRPGKLLTENKIRPYAKRKFSMLKNNPAISVIIPTYNHAQYIIETVKSVLNQTYRDFEIIIIDDGSKDNTRDILNSYIDENLVHYIYQESQGVSAARNTGIKVARGKYSAFMDADDIMLPESLAKRIKFMEKHQDIDFVFTDFFLEDTKSNCNPYPFLKKREMLLSLSPALEKQDGTTYSFHPSYYKMSIKKDIFPITITIMVRKKCFEDVGYFDVNLRMSQDEDMWLRIMRKYKVGFIDEPLSIYKRYRSRISTKDELWYIDAIKYLQDFLNKEEIKSDPELTNAVKKRINRMFFGQGHYYMNNKYFRKARMSFLRSLKYNYRNGRSYLYIAITFLPRRVFDYLKVFKSTIALELEQ